MPCSDSSSSITIKLDGEERLVHFDFAKITCGREIALASEYQKYCQGKTLQEILQLGFSDTVAKLGLAADEEKQYVFYLEWDALRSAIAQYLGVDVEGIDRNRCRISSITHDEVGIEIAQVILPPKELPKILPCSLADHKNN